MNKPQFSNILQNKKAVFVIALVIAIVFWFAITLVENPNTTKDITDITVTFDPSEEIGDGLVGIGYEDKVVSVKISGPSYIVNTVTKDEIVVSAILNETVGNAGEYSFLLTANKNSTKNFTIKSITPKKMTVNYDRWVKDAKFDVNIKTKNIVVASDKYFLSETDATFTNFPNGKAKKISISGPEQIVSKIDSVVAEVEGNKEEKLTDKKVYTANIKLYNANGKELDSSGLSLEFSTIDVTVPVYTTKYVSIGSFLNKPSKYKPNIKFYNESGKLISKVQIKGSPSVLKDIEYIPFKEPIDFRNVKNGKGTFNCELDVPESVFLVDGSTKIKAKINTSNLTTKKFKVSKYIVVNNTDESGNSKYSISVEPITAEICGNKSVLNSLSSSDLRIKIDVAGKMPGKYELDATIVSAKSDNVWQLSKYTASVTISE